MINRYIIFTVILLCAFLSFSQENCDSDVIPCDFPCSEYVTDDNGCPVCECSDGWTPINEDGCYDSNNVTYSPGYQFFITECEYVTCLQVEDGWGGFLDSGIWSELMNLEDCVDSENDVCPNAFTIPSDSFTLFNDNLNQINQDIILLPVMLTGDISISSYQFNLIFNHQFLNIDVESFDIINNSVFYNLYELEPTISNVSNGGAFSVNIIESNDSTSVLSVAYATSQAQSMIEKLLYIPLIVSYEECFSLAFSDGFINDEYVFPNQPNELLISNQDLSECAVDGVVCVSCVDQNDNVLCDELEISGCTDETMFNFNPNATLDNNLCVPFIYGCLDEEACNYNPDANTDNGDCVFEGDTCYVVVSGDCCCCGFCDCVCEQAIEYPLICQGDLTGDYSAANVVIEGQIENCECSSSLEDFSGCTDENACNYDSSANFDDDSCEYIDEVDLGEDIEICDESITLDAGEGYDSYSWSTGETSQEITINESGNYSVTVQNNQENNSSSEYAMSFDGFDDYVSCPEPVIPTSGDFSVSVWAKLGEISTNYSEIVSQGVSGQANFYIGYKPNTGELRFGDDWQNTDLYYPVDDEWHHFTVIKSSSDTHFYLDGILTASLGEAIGNPTAEPFTIGSHILVPELFNGEIDEISVWDIALSETEVNTYMNCVFSGNEDGLVGHWNFEDNNSDTVFDYVNNNNGLIIGDPEYILDTPIQTCQYSNYCSSSNQINVTFSPEGCTDELACNYDSNAICDDESCEYIEEVDLGEDITTCEESITLDAGEGYSSYSWSTGENTQTIEITESGNYSVDVSNGNTNNYSIYFDGITDQNTDQSNYNSNQINTSSSISQFGNYTISFYMKTNFTPLDSGSNDQMFRYWLSDYGVYEINIGGVSGDEYLTGKIFANAPEGNMIYSSDITYNDDEWHHVVVAKNNNSGQLETYVDGILSSITTENIIVGDLAIKIGGDIPAHFYHGFLDEIKVYDDYIPNISCNNFEIFSENLIIHWNLEELNSNENILDDISGNNINATFFGAVFSDEAQTVCPVVACSDSDTINIELNIDACMDLSACNYSPNNICESDNDSCIYPNNCENCNDEGIVQAIDLSLGWSLFSTYVCPFDSNIESIMGELVNNGDLLIVKDDGGNVYWPDFNINGIGSLTNGKGYLIKTLNQSILNIYGDMLNYDFPINIQDGWSYLGYLHQEPGSLENLIAPISDNLIIVKDDNGNVYWPEFGINSILSMSPGEAYQIKLIEDVVFSYPEIENNGRYANSSNSIGASEKPLNTGNNMTIGFPTEAWLNKPDEKDQITAYNSEGLLVGRSNYREEGTVITVWGNDFTTTIKDGMDIGERIQFKLLDFDTDKELTLVITKWGEGTSQYDINGISVASNIISSNEVLLDSYKLYQNIPNPFNDITTIKFHVPEKVEVIIGLYNILGEHVLELSHDIFDAGTHELFFNSNNLSQGNYLLKMSTPNFNDTKRINLIR